MIRAATFDLWETLIREDPEMERRRTERRYEETCRVFGSIPRPRFEFAHQEVWSRLSEQWGRNLDVSIQEQARIYLECLGIIPGEEEVDAFSRAYAGVTLEYPPHLEPSARTVLQSLSEKGIALGLICNTGRTPGWVLKILLDRFGLLRFFGITLFSDEVLIRKPEPSIFLRALSHLGAEPAGAVHVGDTSGTDIAGARAAGMQVIHLDGTVRLEDVPRRIAEL